jgi:hypothetical protein
MVKNLKNQLKQIKCIYQDHMLVKHKTATKALFLHFKCVMASGYPEYQALDLQEKLMS